MVNKEAAAEIKNLIKILRKCHAMGSRQMKMRFLEALVTRINIQGSNMDGRTCSGRLAYHNPSIICICIQLGVSSVVKTPYQ